jgi:hypothetical protein
MFNGLRFEGLKDTVSCLPCVISNIQVYFLVVLSRGELLLISLIVSLEGTLYTNKIVRQR